VVLRALQHATHAAPCALQVADGSRDWLTRRSQSSAGAGAAVLERTGAAAADSGGKPAAAAAAAAAAGGGGSPAGAAPPLAASTSDGSGPLPQVSSTPSDSSGCESGSVAGDARSECDSCSDHSAPGLRPGAAAATATHELGSSPAHGHALRHAASFRRAAHHPTAEALPRVVPSLPSTTGSAGSAGSQLRALPRGVSAAAALPAQAAAPGASGGSDSARLATEGTCVSQSSGGADATAPLSDAGGGGVHDELETVFNMTSACW
jgi:hypothetical protein